jgi:hypothetical protein
VPIGEFRVSSAGTRPQSALMAAYGPSRELPCSTSASEYKEASQRKAVNTLRLPGQRGNACGALLAADDHCLAGWLLTFSIDLRRVV